MCVKLSDWLFLTVCIVFVELQTTHPKDNSPQDNSPYIKLAPRQLAPLSEDNSPHFRRQLAPLSKTAPLYPTYGIRSILLENLRRRKLAQAINREHFQQNGKISVKACLLVMRFNATVNNLTVMSRRRFFFFFFFFFSIH